MSRLIPHVFIEQRIFLVRNHKVIIDKDLADLYGVSTKRLNEQVKRNIRRFPEDFMFRLSRDERDELVAICDRFKTLKHSTVNPAVFTEQGVAMLSSVLNSERAIQVNIVIMRTFVKLRQMLATHKELAGKLRELERRMERQDANIQTIFQAIRKLMDPPPAVKKTKIGFHAD